MTWYYYARLSLGFFLCCEISGPLCQRVGVACEGCVHCWEEDLMKPVRGWFWSKRWRCQSLGGAGDENNFSFFCQKFNNNPKFISGVADITCWGMLLPQKDVPVTSNLQIIRLWWSRWSLLTQVGLPTTCRSSWLPWLERKSLLAHGNGGSGGIQTEIPNCHN